MKVGKEVDPARAAAVGRATVNRYVAEFLGAPRLVYLPVNAWRAVDGRLVLEAGEAGQTIWPAALPTLPAEVVSALGLRPARLQIVRPPTERLAAGVVLRTQVRHVVRLGGRSLVQLLLPGQAEALSLDFDNHQQPLPQPGDRVGLSVGEASLYGHDGQLLAGFASGATDRPDASPAAAARRPASASAAGLRAISSGP